MGQSLKKATTGKSEAAENKISQIIDSCYDKHFGVQAVKEWKNPEIGFYRAVCEAVGEINEKLHYTQFTIKREELKKAYDDAGLNGKTPTKEQFQKILEKASQGLGFTGFDVKYTLLGLFGVPASALFIKNKVMPNAVSNEVLIPSATSLSVLVLAWLNRI